MLRLCTKTGIGEEAAPTADTPNETLPIDFVDHFFKASLN